MILKGFEALQAYLSESRNIVIIGHKNPDGDAVGSTLALHFYLKKKGHKPRVLVPNDFPEFLKWLPKSEKILRFDKQNMQCKNAIAKSDIIFLLDFNALHRVGPEMESVLAFYQNDFVLIDHHLQPDDFTYMYSDISISSTCQMVYQFIEMNNDLHRINEQIATCLYTGIMTDTGSFRFRSTTSKTHRIIADLIDKGAVNDRIHNNVYDVNSHGRLALLGRALNSLTILEEFNTAYIVITQQDKDECNFEKGDTEGVVNYALSVKNVIFAAIFIEDSEQKIVKISFRSKGTFSVNEFARNYFDGGGHTNAAGGRSEISINYTIQKFKSLLPKYKSELLVSYEE